MKVGFLTLFGALLAVTSLQASNPCPGLGMNCIEIANGNNALTGSPITLTTQTETVDLSPYTATLSQTIGNSPTTSVSLKLYCDDLNNDISTGQQYNMNITQLGVGGSLANTQFDTGNPTGSAPNNLPGTSIPIPTGTNLYDEEAWLYTQMMGLSGNNLTAANVTALQEAAWELTSNNLTSAEDSNANGWLTAAYNEAVVNHQAAGSLNGIAFQTATYSDWYVFTDPASANDANSGGYQEFLAYSNTQVTTTQATPEPATFWLLAGALALGGIFLKSRTALRRGV